MSQHLCVKMEIFSKTHSFPPKKSIPSPKQFDPFYISDFKSSLETLSFKKFHYSRALFP